MSNNTKEFTANDGLSAGKLAYESPQIMELDTGTTILSGGGFLFESEGGQFGS